ncbi:MAG: hypothetical protein QME64_03890, partial [bacterium]|nr:hypothetical protein [bacterium]
CFGYSLLKNYCFSRFFQVKYTSLTKEALNIIIFSIFALVIIVNLKKYLQEKYIQKIAKKICTQEFLDKYVDLLSTNKDKDEFTECQVYGFLKKELIPQNRLIRFLTTKILKLYNDVTIDGLKDIFIFNLLNKQLIKIWGVSNLDRKFRILTEYYDYGLSNLD